MSHDSHHHERISDTCNAASVSDRASLLAARHLGGYLTVGAVWVNDHTGEETTLTAFESRVERLPDPAGGFRDHPEFVIHHTLNVPPGFARGYGDDLGEFLKHWQPREVKRAQ